MIAFLWSIGATFVVSLISLISIVFLSFKEKVLEKILLILVGFSAGALLGNAFFHLIPEIVEEGVSQAVFIYIVVGFCLFFILEKFIFWHHCHTYKCEVKTFTYMNLVGDGLHNFIDGLVIAASFVTSIELGLATTLAVLIHEIPQEISDFGVLIYGGFSRGKALLYNFLSALLAIIGAVAGFALVLNIEGVTKFLLAFTAGGFIYIAAADLIPELHKEIKIKKYLLSFVSFLASLVLMYFIKVWFD
ncbi:MAG TPA: ZIP family metal transporter [Patescibacteria group bacterium]